MKRFTKAVLKFLYRVSGLKAVVSLVESAVLRYRLRVRMVPVSYKLFVLSLGILIGGSGVYLQLTAPEFVKSLEKNSVAGVHMNGALAAEKPVEVKNEAKELTIEEKIAKTFPENPKVMIAVFKAESGLNPMAVNINKNGSVDIGVAQINSVHKKDQLELFDVDKNLAVAREIYEKQGIMAWYAFQNGSYLKHLK